jgi:LL-diaminopimelate aminotransferase
LSVARRILEEQSVVVIPGIGFGAEGEGYVRMALTVEASRLAEAAHRIAAIRW